MLRNRQWDEESSRQLDTDFSIKRRTVLVNGTKTNCHWNNPMNGQWSSSRQ